MARQFDGIDDFAVTAASLNLSAANKLTVAFWLYWDAFSNNDDLAMEFTSNYNNNTGSFIVDPNSGTTFFVGIRGDVGYNTADLARPSAAAWHHYVLVFDFAEGVNEVVAVYINNAAQTLTRGNVANNTATLTFANAPLYLMSRAGSSIFGAGRQAAVGIWSRILTGTEIGNLAGGALPTTITSNLVASWRMSATGTTETDASGNGNTLNYTGTTVVDDPPALVPPGDTTAPTFTSWAVDGATLVGTASETLDQQVYGSPERHIVKVGGVARTVTGVVVSGTTATLTLATPVISTDVVTVSGSPGTPS